MEAQFEAVKTYMHYTSLIPVFGGTLVCMILGSCTTKRGYSCKHVVIKTVPLRNVKILAYHVGVCISISFMLSLI